MATQGTSAQKGREAKELEVDLASHRRILNFLNQAVRPEDLAFEKVAPPNPEVDLIHEDNPEERHLRRKKLLELDVARKIIEFRDGEYPLGFRHLKELLPPKLLDPQILKDLLLYFGRRFYGSWSVFPQPIPRRGPGGYDGVVHAAMLQTGKVLFITADETTVLWNPADSTPATFEDPVNQPHQIPNATGRLFAVVRRPLVSFRWSASRGRWRRIRPQR